MKYADDKQNGLTVVELLIILAAIAIVVMISVPGSTVVLEHYRLKAASSNLVESLNLAKQEALRIAELIREMVFDIIFAFTDKNDQILQPVRDKEELVDYLTAETNAYLSLLTRGNVGDEMVKEAFQIMYVVNEFEQIGDISSRVLGGRAEKWLEDDKAQFSEQGKNSKKW